jgi:hypothetical protein
MTFNGNQHQEQTGPPIQEAPPGSILPTPITDGPDGEPPAEMVEVDEILAELADRDPAEATVPLARVAELLGSALDREGR